MQQAAFVFTILVLLLPVGVIICFFFRFLSLPIFLKARAIKKAASQLQKAREDYPKTITKLNQDFEKQINGVKEKVLLGMLRGIPLIKLGEYPGIGPATVEKIRAAGIKDFPGLIKANLGGVSGFGPKRIGDIRNAVGNLQRDLLSRLDSGACQESRQIATQRELLDTEWKNRLAEWEFQDQWRRDILHSMGKTIEEAQSVAFVPWLFGQPMPSGLPDPPGLLPPPFVPSGKAPVPDSSPPEKTKGNSSITLEEKKIDRDPPLIFPKGPREKAYRSAPESDGNQVGSDEKEKDSWDPVDEMEIVARIGIAVGMADGRFAESEQVVIRRFLNEIYGGDPEKKGRIGSICEECSINKADLESVLNAAVSKVEKNLWPKLVSWVGQIADAAGKRGIREIAVIEQVRQKLSDSLPFPNEGLVKSDTIPPIVKSQADFPGNGQTESPRKTLEIIESATLSPRLIRSQWKALRDKYDPGKFSGHGSDFIVMAERKRVAVDQAAKTLLGELGEEPILEEPAKDLRHNPDLDAAFGL